MKEDVLVYTNSRGESIQFGGDSPYYIQSSELRGYKRSPVEVGGKIVSLPRQRQELAVRVVYEREKGDEPPNKLFDVLVVDNDSAHPGTLSSDTGYIRCFTPKCSDAPDDSFHDVEYDFDITFMLLDDYWTKEKTDSLVTREDEDVNGLDFPHDYPHDYNPSASWGQIENDSGLSAPVKISVAGPASDWFVRIGTNVYSCTKELGDGEVLIIDGLNHKITHRDHLGVEENAYSTQKGVRRLGSGSYIFEPVPPGSHGSEWGGCAGFEYVLYQQYDERRWA